MLPDQAHEQGMAVGVEVASVEQELIEGPGLVGDPGAEGGDERIAADEAVLQGQEAEQQVTGGVTKRWGSGVIAHGEPPRRLGDEGYRSSSRLAAYRASFSVSRAS